MLWGESAVLTIGHIIYTEMFHLVDKVCIKKQQHDIKTTYHSFHKQVMDGVFYKKDASCNAVLSLVEEH